MKNTIQNARKLTIQSKLSFNLAVSEKLEQKIRHLCNVFEKKEWSGILFYKKEGNVGESGFSIEALDLCLMDIGTSGFTEFDDSEDIIKYRVDNEELLQDGIYEGLIHSHNNFNAFFSGTDVSTLEKEGRDTNHFLSLIVNNAGEYVARITRRLNRNVTAEIVKNAKIESDYYTFGNRHMTMLPLSEETKNNETETQDVIEWFEAKITKPDVVIPKYIKQEINERIDEIKSRIVETPKIYKAEPFRQLSFDFGYDIDNYGFTEIPNSSIIYAAESLCYRIATGELFSKMSRFSETYLKVCLNNIDKKYASLFENIENNTDFADFLFNFVCTLTDYPKQFLGIDGFDSETMYAVLEEAARIIDTNVVNGYVKRIIMETITDFLNY